jgi:hypothetical protein
MKPVGFTWLKDYFQLSTAAPLTHESYIGGRRRIEIPTPSCTVVETFTPNYFPRANTPLDHVEFALKYDDLHLDLLKKIFENIPASDITSYINTRPTSKYGRQLGFFYEFLFAKTLELANNVTGNYVDLIDSNKYVVAKVAKRNQRWLINDNLLGTPDFCPIVRKTALVTQYLQSDFTARLKTFQGSIPANLFRRAIDYLYYKETKSSYSIEHETPTPDREAKFVELLRSAGTGSAGETLSEHFLAEIQSVIVDPRFAHANFRTWQNYIGQTKLGGEQRIHYVCPPGSFVRSLMDGLGQVAVKSHGVNPVIRASVIAFGFVFIHPFEDGNGRLHRFLIHHTLAHDQFVPEGMILPVSAYMLHNQGEYDAVLERFSKPLSQIVNYSLNENDEMTVHNPQSVEGYYRFPDLTAQVEYLFHAIEQTINKELIAEVLFLQHYDEAREKIQAIVDLPDRQLDLMIKLLHQNKGALSKTKRAQFYQLTDIEIQQIEAEFKTINFDLIV